MGSDSSHYGLVLLPISIVWAPVMEAPARRMDLIQAKCLVYPLNLAVKGKLITTTSRQP